MLPLRAVFVLTGVTLLGATAGLAGWHVTTAAHPSEALTSPTSGSAEDLTLAAAGVGLLLVGAWCLATALACSVDLLRGVADLPIDRRPSGLRALVLKACAPTMGAVLLVGTAATASAADEPSLPGTSVGSALVGLPLPTRPVTSPAAFGSEPGAHERPDGDRAAGAPSGAGVRRIRPGECLWDIAAARLPASASHADIDRAWRVLYRANRSRIGPDPGLVTPGTPLVVPLSLSPRTRR
jgi:hypothetical protein